MTSGKAIWIGSQCYLRGYRRGWRMNPKPYRWARLFTLLSAILLAVSIGASFAITWTAVELALANTSVGQLVPPTKIGKIAAWLRIYGASNRGQR